MDSQQKQTEVEEGREDMVDQTIGKC